nr:hypothetical protein [Mycoplasmopsis canis]WQQ12216.1 hypothetical protein RRG48_02410 [Mycoplasmopsis canis]
MKRKFLLLGSVFASLAVPATAIACTPSGNGAVSHTSNSESGDGVTSTFANFANRGIYRIKYNSIYSQRRGQTDASYSSGSWQAGPEITTYGLLFRQESEGKPEFEEKTELASNKIDRVTKTFVVKPSTNKWKLDYAKSIKLTIGDEVKVYDNDKTDALGAPTIEGKYYASSNIALTSSDAKSINNPQFFTDLDKASKFEVEVDETSFWVNSNGEKTKYNVVAKDFYYGLVRTYLTQDTTARHKNGGNAEIDEQAKKLIPDNSSVFKKENSYTNKYLFNLYNIDFDKLIDKNEALKSEDGKNYLVFQRKDANLSSNFVEFFKNILYGNYEFVPAPSQYIDETNKNISSLRNFAGVNSSEESTVAPEIAKATNLAKDSGVYWYGLNNNTTLYAGRYYYKGYSANDLSEKWLLNKHYKDQEYVNHPGRLQVIENVYKSAVVDADAFKVEDFNSFRAGETSRISFSQLDPNTQAQIRAKKEVFGLSKSQSKETKSTIGYYFNALVPNYAHNDKDSAQYVNNAFSKLMWGAELNDVKAGNAHNVLVNATTGAAAEVRNILSAVINWDESAKEAGSPEAVHAWLTGAAPDLKIKEDANDTTNSPRYHADELNELFVVDRNTNQRVDLGGSLGTELRQSENNSVGAQSSDKYKSAAFEVLKARFKTIIDEFYKQNPNLDSDPNNSKIKFTVISRFINFNAKIKLATEKQVNVLNSLYPERFQVEFRKVANRDELLSYYVNNPAATKIVGWSTDYELLNGSLDGKSWNFQLLPILANIASDESYKAKLESAYPTLVKAAQKLKEFIKLKNFELSIPLEKWGKLSNKYLYDFSNYLGEYKVKEGSSDTALELVEIDREQDTKQYVSAGELSSQFLLWLNSDSANSFSKDELIKLTSETMNIVGVTVNPYLAILQNSVSNTLVNPNYIVPEILHSFEDMSSFLVKK